MKKLIALISATVLTSNFGAAAFAASPDIYVVNFRADTNTESVQLDSQLASAIAIAGVSAEEVTIDISTVAKWEKGAHEAFDRDIVPVFNQWVGLPGFAAIVDAKSKRVLGCVNSRFDASEMAQEIRKMASRAFGQAYMSHASYDFEMETDYIVYTSTTRKTTQCPPAFNVDTGL